MISLRSLILLGLTVAGCTRENPAFEGGDELLEESDETSKGEGEGETRGNEATSTSDTSTTSDPSTSTTSDPSTSTTSDPSTSTTSDPSTSTSEGTESTDTLATSDGPDPGLVCEDIFVVGDCMDCVLAGCCDDDGDNDGDNAYCFGPSACGCMLNCLLMGGFADACASDCGADDIEYFDALATYDCAKESCLDICS